MRELLIRALKAAEISGWLIEEIAIGSKELFSSGGNIDLIRGKDVVKYRVVVYTDHDGFRGDAKFSVYSSTSEEELNLEISRAVRAAKSVNNRPYPLASGEKFEQKGEKRDLLKIMGDISTTVINKTHKDAKVNSFEVFVEEGTKRILNSNGVDVSFPIFRETIELITEAEGKNEPVEVYCLLNFKDTDGHILGRTLEEKLEEAALRAEAEPMLSLDNINVYLSGENVKDFFEYFLSQTSVPMAYRNMSSYKEGDEIKSKDLISIELKPLMENSASSMPYDSDGVKLSDTVIIKDGKFVKLHGSLRFSHYMHTAPTGTIKNFEVKGGTLSEEERKTAPYLEILAFSDFLMDPLTGEFGGEIRLAKYFDGKEIRPVTGGSFTTVMSDALPSLRLSKELQERDGFIGPKVIGFSDMTVLGINK